MHVSPLERTIASRMKRFYGISPPAFLSSFSASRTERGARAKVHLFRKRLVPSRVLTTPRRAATLLFLVRRGPIPVLPVPRNGGATNLLGRERRRVHPFLMERCSHLQRVGRTVCNARVMSTFPGISPRPPPARVKPHRHLPTLT